MTIRTTYSNLSPHDDSNARSACFFEYDWYTADTYTVLRDFSTRSDGMVPNARARVRAFVTFLTHAPLNHFPRWTSSDTTFERTHASSRLDCVRAHTIRGERRAQRERGRGIYDNSINHVVSCAPRSFYVRRIVIFFIIRSRYIRARSVTCTSCPNGQEQNATADDARNTLLLIILLYNVYDNLIDCWMKCSKWLVKTIIY